MEGARAGEINEEIREGLGTRPRLQGDVELDLGEFSADVSCPNRGVSLPYLVKIGHVLVRP